MSVLQRLTGQGQTPGRRKAILLILVALVLTIVAVYYTAPRQPTAQSAQAGLQAARVRAQAKAKALARSKAAVVAPKTLITAGRVVPSTQAADLFAPHSWYVAPPPPAAAAEEAPAAPTAPPLPYTYVGSYAPAGERATYFLARGDRVVDAHVGDKLDGSLLFEKIEGGQLVFNYLPLNIRQTLPTGVVQ